MTHSVKSIIDSEPDGTIISVESHITHGLPAIIIVGYGNKSIDEARERLRGAFANSGLRLPPQRITINLAPADIPKDGSAFDLAIAMSILLFQLPATPTEGTVFIGELGLDGSLRPVRGIIGKILAARRLGYRRFVVPRQNAEQVQLIPKVSIIAANSLHEIYAHYSGLQPLQPLSQTGRTFASRNNKLDDFSAIKGHQQRPNEL